MSEGARNSIKKSSNLFFIIYAYLPIMSNLQDFKAFPSRFRYCMATVVQETIRSWLVDNAVLMLQVIALSKNKPHIKVQDPDNLLTEAELYAASTRQ